MADKNKKTIVKITAANAGEALMKLAAEGKSQFGVVAASNFKPTNNSETTKSVLLGLPLKRLPKSSVNKLPDHVERRVSDWEVAGLVRKADEIERFATDESGATKKLLELINALKKTKEWVALKEHSKQNGHFQHLPVILWEKMVQEAELNREKEKSQK